MSYLIDKSTGRPNVLSLALVTLVVMYLATTGFGAALFTTEIGKEQLGAFIGGDVPFGWMSTIGTPVYWTLLLSLVILVPPFAIAANLAASRFFPRPPAFDVPLWVPVLLFSALAGFCIYQLADAGGLTAREAWDHSICYTGKIERRAALLKLLGNTYYNFAYSSLPILGCFVLAKAILQRSRAALVVFFLLSAVIFWIEICTVMKAPAILYVGFIALTMILCGVGIIRTLGVMIPIAAGMFLGLSAMQYCDRSENNEPFKKMGSGHFLTNAAFRMAGSFPYYVQTFSDSSERCGFELPRSISPTVTRCYPPTKIFRAMYPSINYVVGFAPAPAQVAAYAEVGMLYALFVPAMIGIIIGALAFFARGASPLSVTAGVALCIYAYYVTQASMTGALLHSYGLFWLLLPLFVMIAVSLSRRRATASE